MAIITTPAAGVSPYEPTTAAPTVLRAGADGSTVSTSAAAAAATVSELAAANANTLVVVSGEAALNSLITSSQPGVFEGANVTINLEEQNFTTTNQVTSTINSPSGSTGEIQYNSGANSFASDPYFTYTNSNVVTPGIRTNSYLYANGAPFLAGGNAAIGNFVFNGDTMTISDSNQTMNITGNGTGNINVNANGNTWIFDNNRILTLPGGPRIVPVGANLELQAASGGYAEIVTSDGNNYVAVTGSDAQIVTSGINTWTFDNVGNLILPGNTFAVKYANGNPVVISGGSLPLANGTSNIDIATANGNVTVTANGSPTWTFKSDGNLSLPTAGNIVGAVNIIGNGTGNVNVIANNRAWTFAADGNLVLPLAGNIVNPYDYGSTWNFGASGNLTLPANIIAINYANGNRVTGNITFRDEIVIGTGTSNLISGLYLAPSSSSADANMYLRVRGNINDEPTHIHFDTGNNAYYNQFIGDDNKYIQLANTGNIVINSNDVAGNSAQWTFAADGNLNLPLGGVVSEGASPLGLGNTIALTPSGGSDADQQLLVYPTGNVVEGNHLHLTTGNLLNTELYLGNDDFYVKLANTGNITVNTAGNTAQWTFATDGNLTFPTGNLVITPDDPAGNVAVIASTDHPLAILSTGANGSTATFWVEDYANFGTSNIAAVYVNPVSQTGNVQIQTGNNSSITAWNFTPDGNLTLPNGAVINDTVGNAVAFGRDAAATGPQGNAAVAIGQQAGETSQGASAVAIGYQAGLNTQGINAVAIGPNAGNNNQGGGTVAIGYHSGKIQQGTGAVAVGADAGANVQGDYTVAVGLQAGNSLQGDYAVAVGFNAGYDTQGVNSVAIGSYAGQSAQGNNSIIINATGAGLNALTANTFTVAPVRNDVANIANIMFYNATSNEITYGNVISVAGNITGGNVLTAGQVSATGNITGGNLSVTGNITGNTAGFALGYLNVPQVSFAGNATIAATDAGKHYYSVLSTANVLTIANNTSVSWVVGTAISLVNQGTGNITVAQGTGVSLYLAGNITSGNRTVATYGMATLLNVAANVWMINGTGVS